MKNHQYYLNSLFDEYECDSDLIFKSFFQVTIHHMSKISDKPRNGKIIFNYAILFGHSSADKRKRIRGNRISKVQIPTHTKFMWNKVNKAIFFHKEYDENKNNFSWIFQTSNMCSGGWYFWRLDMMSDKTVWVADISRPHVRLTHATGLCLVICQINGFVGIPTIGFSINIKYGSKYSPLLN